MNLLKAKEGLPRHRPPYVAQKGIFNKPTLVNNIETLYWIREIIEKGGKNFQAKEQKIILGLEVTQFLEE